MMFVQIACTYTSEELISRKILALYVGCMIVASSLFIMVYTDYLDKRFKMAKKVTRRGHCFRG